MSRARVRTGFGAVLVLAVLAGVALLVGRPWAGPGSTAAPTSSRPQPQADAPGAARTDAVRALLARRADAVLHRNRGKFLTTVDPAAPTAFRARQNELFDNLVGVPLASWAYQVDPADPVDPATLHPADRTDLEVGGDELWVPRTSLDYALRGVDSAPTSHGLGYAYVRRGTQWYLRSDTALDGTDRRGWRGPWDFGPCRSLTGKHGIVLYHQGNEALAGTLAGELDGAVQAVTDVWGTGWSRRVAFVLPDTVSEMRALVGPDFPIDAVVAVSIADRVDRDRHAVYGQRVVFSPMGSRGLSPVALRVVVRHELTHVAARADTVDGTPLWVLEGFADYVGYRTSGITMNQGAPDLAQSVRAGQVPATLPSDTVFQTGGRDLEVAYQQAWTVMRYLAHRFGEPKLVQLYRSLAAVGNQPPDELDAQLTQLVGLDRAGLIAGWQQYLRTNLG